MLTTDQAAPGRALRGAAPPGAPTEGRRMLTAIVEGDAVDPPAAGTLALPPATDWAPGHVRCETVLGAEFTLTPGVVFGGWIACLVDHFAGLVMLSALPDTSGFLTAGLSVEYHAPLTPGPAVVETRLTRCTTRHALVTVEFHQDGTVAATGSVEQIIHRRRPGGADAAE
ncbi:MAG TPA: PaaI family thioesterase [Streptomyces sp.]|nr:PaaI family thioesterase [Streptomyces sp.]